MKSTCPRAPVSTFRVPAALAAILLAPLVLLAGCNTSQDASAAATQMSATAKSLCDYYASVGKILSDTDRIYSLNEALYDKPYSAQSRQELKTTQSELARRVALASDLSTLAGSFAKLTGSTAPADVAAAGTKLEAEADSLASYTASTAEQNAIKSALQLLVAAVKAHKEREAAQAMDALASGLSALFDKEAPSWKSVDDVYVQLAATLAGQLVAENAVDDSALLKPALDPFELTPSTPSPQLTAKLTPLAKQQISTQQAALQSGFDKATGDMSTSLQEMSKRIHLVATGKPMAFRIPPLTLDNVEKWANKVQSY
jgi:hypothetical protein